ncbi:MAG: DUF3754 domain-containing protein [Planctomycetota bacterium]
MDETCSTCAEGGGTKPVTPRRGDRYVPVQYRELLEVVAGELPREAKEKLRRAAWLMENLIEHRMGEVEESVKEAYLPFCPDDPCVTRFPPSPERLSELHDRFFSELQALLEKANYEKITREKFEEAVEAGTTKGLRVDVDLDQYEDFAVYFRGRGEMTIRRRDLKSRFRKRERTVPMYLRAVIVTRQKESPHIHLDLYKDIPMRDIESLLPGTKLRMRVFDKAKLTGTGGAAMYSAFKIGVQGAFLVGKTFLFPLVFLAGLAYLGRTTFRFFKIRDDYRKNLIRDLFFKCLDSNLGVINRIVDTTEEEECKEALLAYAFAHREGKPIEMDALRSRIQEYLREGWGIEAVFDLADARAKLLDLGLATESEGRLEAVSLETAIETLDRLWDNIFVAKQEKGSGDGDGE